MIEQQGFKQRLRQVDQMIIAAQMTQFVSEDQLDLLTRKTERNGHRQQDHRLEPSDQRRCVDARGYQNTDLTREPEAPRKPAKDRFKLDTRHGMMARDVSQHSPLIQRAAGHAEHANHPTQDQPRKVAVNLNRNGAVCGRDSGRDMPLRSERRSGRSSYLDHLPMQQGPEG